jgi:hypothetical protein
VENKKGRIKRKNKNEMCSSNSKLYMVLNCYSHIQTLSTRKKNFITNDKEQERITRAIN